MKWPQMIFVLVGVIVVALAVRARRATDSAAAAVAATPVPALPDIGRPLPPSFDRPGVVSRQIGLLRVYLAVVPEIVREKAPQMPLITDTVPILLVLENDTYQPLAGTALGWLGGQLAAVTVYRVGAGGRDEEVFQTDLPLPARADWLSAERRNFTVDWPLPAGTSGHYRITVQLALPDQPTLEIALRVL